MTVVSVSTETNTTATSRELPARKPCSTRIVPLVGMSSAASCRVRLPILEPGCVGPADQRARSTATGWHARPSAVDKMFLWDPLVAGQAQDKLALMLIKGEKIGPGLDLGLPGYHNLKRIPGTPHALAGSGWIMVDKPNARQYPF
jgi:hypothetical protein